MTNAMKLTSKITAGALVLAIGAVSIGYATQAEARKGHGDRGPKVTFEQLDANSDGQVTQAELDAYRLARFSAMDTNGDGGLSAEELVAAAKEGHEERAQKRADRMIEKRDANGDGKIAQDEMKDRRAGKMIEKLDTDKDGQISKAEFDAMKDKRADRRKAKRQNADN